MKLTFDEIREAAEADLLVFIRLTMPWLMLGDAHIELINWWQSSQRKDNVLILLPRGHLKSKLIAAKTAWELTRDPSETILYASATSALAEKQLHAIKRILDSKVYRKYWPNMVNPEEGKRERWTADEIALDHPIRAKEGIRDPSVKAVGLTTNFTGFHATKIKLDDIVVPKNAYTEDGREKVRNLVSQLSSIAEPEARMDAVGTRYHDQDQYNTFLNQKYKIFDEETFEVIGEEYLWDSYTKQVEVNGEFLWPRKRRDDGKAFGFDMNVLAKIKAGYEDKTQFFAQYYNNPNDPETVNIGREQFQYYDRRFLKNVNDRWYFNERPLNVYAGLDFAYSLTRKADFTALVVIGIDFEHNIYVLDIDRFKTQKISNYFAAVEKAFRTWGFRKLRAEVTAAQEVIVRDLKDNYIATSGMPIVVDEYRPSRAEGSKEERIQATLQHRYENRKMWHYKGGFTVELEDELVSARPPHDDISDGLTAAINVAQAPPRGRMLNQERKNNLIYHPRFGGVSR